MRREFASPDALQHAMLQRCIAPRSGGVCFYGERPRTISASLCAAQHPGLHCGRERMHATQHTGEHS